jgi:hypothetical protein
MSLSAFDNLRATHPDQLDAVAALERQIHGTLRHDRHAIIDDDILWEQLHLDRDMTRRFLIELETLRALVRRLFWLCPLGRGTAAEASRLEDFPEEIECERCGLQHQLTSSDVEVKFTPSEGLLREVVATTQQ